MKTILIDNHDSFTYNIVDLLRKSKHPSFEVVKSNKVELDSIAEFDKIIFSPGHGTPSDFPILHLLLDRYKQTHSFLGICLGHQAICAYFGASLYQLPTVCHGQQHTIHLEEPRDYLFEGLPARLQVGLYHSWAVNSASLPWELQATATSENQVLMSVAHREYDIRGIQFHAESFLTTQGIYMLDNFLSHRRIGTSAYTA